MFREEIPAKSFVREAGWILVIGSAVAGFFLIRHGLETNQLLVALCWIPLLLPFVWGFFLASARVASAIEDGQLRVRLAPFASRQIPISEIASVEDLPEVALSDGWRGSRDGASPTIAAPFDRGPGVRITTRERKALRLRTNLSEDVRRAIAQG